MPKALLLLLSIIVAGCQSAGTQQDAFRHAMALAPAPQAQAQAQAEIVEEKYAAIVVDARTGQVLHEANAEAPRYPASLTKMMTLYLLFEEIESGRLSLGSELLVSAQAAAQPPSKLGLAAGSTIRVHEAIQSLAIRSANDVAVVVAENIAGSEEAFAARMNRTARALGLQRTNFRNASGLPDPGQITTARDMAQLGRALQAHHPRHYGYFSMREFTYGGQRREATNKLLGVVPGLDGIKTGYIRASGFNLVASARRGGRHVIAVVMGGESGAKRDAHMVELLDRFLPAGAPAQQRLVWSTLD